MRSTKLVWYAAKEYQKGTIGYKNHPRSIMLHVCEKEVKTDTGSYRGHLFPTRFDMTWAMFSQSSIFLSSLVFEESCRILRGFQNVLLGKNIVHLLRALKASMEIKCLFAHCRGGSQDFSRVMHNFPNLSNHTPYPRNPKCFSGDLRWGYEFEQRVFTEYEMTTKSSNVLWPFSVHWLQLFKDYCWSFISQQACSISDFCFSTNKQFLTAVWHF